MKEPKPQYTIYGRDGSGVTNKSNALLRLIANGTKSTEDTKNEGDDGKSACQIHSLGGDDRLGVIARRLRSRQPSGG